MDPNAIGTQFTSAAVSYANAIQPYAAKLFFALLFIEVLVTAVQYMIDQGDAPHYVGRSFRHLLSAGFIYLMLINAFPWMAAIVHSFGSIGAAVSGVPNLDPSTVLSIGSQMAYTIYDTPSTSGAMPNFSLALGQTAAAFFILLSFTVVAALALLVVIEAYLVIAGASILLAFGGSRFTAPIAEGYFGNVIKVGVRLLFFYLMLGIGIRIANQWSAALKAACVPTTTTLPWYATYGVPPSSIITTVCTAPMNWHLLLSLVANCLILMIVTTVVPSTAAGIVSGTAGLALTQAFEAAFIARTVIQPVSGILQAATTKAVRALGGSDESLDGRLRANERYRPQPLTAAPTRLSATATAGNSEFPDPNASTEILDARRTRTIEGSNGRADPSTINLSRNGDKRDTNNLGLANRPTAKI